MGDDCTRHGAIIIDIAAVGTAIRRFVRSLLPKQIVEFAQQLRLLSSAERAFFIRLRIQRWRGTRRDELAKMSAVERRVLFVCHGNIIRSPMCEALLRDIALRAGDPDLTIESAGLHATPGKPADLRARVAAANFGVSLESHRATRLGAEAVERADVVFVMDWLNEAQLLARFPNSQSKVVLLGSFGRVGSHLPPVVPDPYSEGAEAVTACFERLDVAVHTIARQIVRPRESQPESMLA